MALHGSAPQPWIDRLAMETINYVRETSNVPLGPRPLKLAAIPYFLRDRYRFLEGELLTRRSLFVAPTNSELDTPAQMAKHLVQLKKVTDAVDILLLPTIWA